MGSRSKSPAAKSIAVHEASSAPPTNSNRATDLRHQTIRKQQEEKEVTRLAKELEEEKLTNKLSQTRVAPHVPYGDLQTHYKSIEKKNAENVLRQSRQMKEELEQAKEKRQTKLQDREFLFEKDFANQVRDRVMGQVEQTLRESGVSYLYDSISKKQKSKS
jgi:patatin-like phospholipase/acyl hydrolase